MEAWRPAGGGQYEARMRPRSAPLPAYPGQPPTGLLRNPDITWGAAPPASYAERYALGARPDFNVASSSRPYTPTNPPQVPASTRVPSPLPPLHSSQPTSPALNTSPETRTIEVELEDEEKKLPGDETVTTQTPKPKKKGYNPFTKDTLVVARSCVDNLLFIGLVLAAVYVYTLIGGIILLQLDKGTETATADAIAATVGGLNFSAAQLAWLASFGVPPDPPPTPLDLVGGQFYATTLVTSIGYGNRTSYSTGARWFAVVFSAVGLAVTLTLVFSMSSRIFRFVNNFGLLLLDVFLPVEIREGRAKRMLKQVQHLYNQLDADGDGSLYLWQIREILIALQQTSEDQEEVTILTAEDAEKGHLAAKRRPPPDWETVCELAAKADKDRSGDISREEFPKVLEAFALRVLAQEEMECHSVFLFKVIILVSWMLLGAAVYSNCCTDCIPNFGDAFYFVFITLSTIGTGDFYPCSKGCRTFWFFHTILGLGLLAATVEVMAWHLVNFVSMARHQRVELSPNYTYRITWGSAGRFASRYAVVLRAVQGVGIVLAYAIVGAAVFTAYEAGPEANAIRQAQASFDAQAFDAPQSTFVLSWYSEFLKTNWGFPGALRYSMEVITTIGYGVYAPQTSGARTAVIFYAILGLSIVGLQLNNFAQALALLPVVVWDHLSQLITRKKLSARQRAIQKVTVMNLILGSLDKVANGAENLPLEELRAQLDGLPGLNDCDVSIVDEVLAEVDDDGDHNINLRVASIKLAHLYGDVVYHKHLWKFAGGIFVTVVIYGMSIPIFMALEGWSLGDSSWFVYITSTTIGLGDFAPHSTGGTVYWYFFVFCTIGNLSILIAAFVGMSREWKRRLRDWRLLHSWAWR